MHTTRRGATGGCAVRAVRQQIMRTMSGSCCAQTCARLTRGWREPGTGLQPAAAQGVRIGCEVCCVRRREVATAMRGPGTPSEARLLRAGCRQHKRLPGTHLTPGVTSLSSLSRQQSGSRPVPPGRFASRALLQACTFFARSTSWSRNAAVRNEDRWW